MKYCHLDILRCPLTREELKLDVYEEHEDEIISGRLFSSKTEYPINNGIPRFIINDSYSKNFAFQWNRWAKVQFESENIGRPMAGETTRMFKAITELNDEILKDKTIIDIGCGPGRFVDVSRHLGAKLIIALDHSSAIDQAKDNFDDTTGILFVQGDALNLPFKDGFIDFAYSIGVLHHTPDLSKGVQEAHRILRKDGEFAISVYLKGSYYNSFIVQFWRNIFKSSWPIFKHHLPYLYAQTFGRVNHYIRRVSRVLSLPIRVIFPSVTLPDVRWSVLDTFDSITPSYQSAHTLYEVYSLFKKVKFSTIRVAAWENIIGRK